MDQEALVSIITPCFNGEFFVERFLDSILNQTYKRIELIFINDGSTDKTEEIVLSYISAFEKQGMKFVYKSQANAGQAAALNEGLKLFTGEYLTWPDSDDYLAHTSIEKRVRFLKKHPEYGFVRSNAWYVDYYTLKNIRKVSVLPKRYESRLFDGLITGIQFWVNGCYLIRTSAFLAVNPDRHIECSSVGQNVQMLLPVAFKFLCGYIDECLFYYVNTPNSHSRIRRTYHQAFSRCDEFYGLLHSTCDKIDMLESERKEYERLLDRLWILAHRKLALQYEQIEDYEKYMMEYKREYLYFCFIPISWRYFWNRWEYKIKTRCKNWIKQLMR